MLYLSSIHLLYSLVTNRVKSNALSDGHHYTPNSIYSYLTRVMYARRTKINPIWNKLIVGGYEDRTP